MAMFCRSISYVLVVGFVFWACGTNAPSNNSNGAAAHDSVLAPVESGTPNTNYKPAFAGQTRAPGVKTTTAYGATIITNKLNEPWGIGFLPDGRFIVTEKGGKIRIVTPAGEVGAPLSGVPQVAVGGQGGMLGITLDPQFATNRMVYWVFSEATPEGNVTAVAKGKLSDDARSMENARVIYRAAPAFRGNLHFGGRVLFDGTGNLVVSTGDRFDRATRPLAQDLNAALGKVVRITPEGQPAPGNPFIGRSGARAEVYSYGHRNVQSLAFHPETGELWEAEFGPRGGDELNLIQPGKNYGWPVITYGIEYGGQTIGGGITQKEGMEQPVYYWDPVLSPSGMTFYSGNEIPEWKNNLFIGGLNSNHIARLVIRNNRVAGEERILASENQRFRDVQQGKDGALYAITDEGRLYRIGKK